MNKKEALEVLQDIIGERWSTWEEFEKGHCDEAIIIEQDAAFTKAFEALDVLRTPYKTDKIREALDRFGEVWASTDIAYDYTNDEIEEVNELLLDADAELRGFSDE